MNKFRQPAHTVSPLWLLDEAYVGLDKHSKIAKNAADIFNKIYTSDAQLPKRILFVSAHLESNSKSIETSKPVAPEILYDYSGFPVESYGAKGDPEFATRVLFTLLYQSTGRHPHRHHVHQRPHA
ncbi:hypothetical protein P3T76_015030 [Phytophthora citrophthora]|uniref:Uncharacterized protein n=1 Tax=Phytophthora citrophthora TaxID=4793 RepID=A0AAD9G048_9STRA|nr:hypothetical protein P3T76_015030 [Phytophthora citrophthora]